MDARRTSKDRRMPLPSITAGIVAVLLGLGAPTAANAAQSSSPQPPGADGLATGVTILDAGTSQNGWPANSDPSAINVANFSVPGTSPTRSLSVRSGDVKTILIGVAARFNSTVEPLGADIGGYNYRVIAGSNVLSNHASGTAIDLNWNEHPQGQSGTFTSAQVAAIRSILGLCGNVVRWGGDYNTTVDEMHFEINVPPGSSSLATCAQAMADGAPSVSMAVGDVSGDGYADIVAAKPDGTLWYYPNNINANGTPYGAGSQIGSGWSSFTRLMLADVSGDGYADLLATKSDGTLWYYPNNINANGTPYGSGRQVGTGWAGMLQVSAGDVSGDGYADVVAVKADGTLWYFPNNINANGTPYGAGSQIGSGWTGFDRFTLADVTGDGYVDILATKPDGTLWYYGNNIKVNGTPYGSGRQVGTGWTTFTRIGAGDLTGDGYAEALGIKPDGTLWYFPNNINANGTPYGSGYQIGTGWTTFKL